MWNCPLPPETKVPPSFPLPTIDGPDIRVGIGRDEKSGVCGEEGCKRMGGSSFTGEFPLDDGEEGEDEVEEEVWEVEVADDEEPSRFRGGIRVGVGKRGAVGGS